MLHSSRLLFYKPLQNWVIGHGGRSNLRAINFILTEVQQFPFLGIITLQIVASPWLTFGILKKLICMIFPLVFIAFMKERADSNILDIPSP